MELEQTKAQFAAHGMQVAAVAHDTVEILDHFARRKAITYPMLADANGKVAMAFDIVNPNYPKGHELHGMPFPGTYIVDENGIVQSKLFEQDHRERYTASRILVEQFHDAAGKAVSSVKTKHLRLTASASDAVVRPGNRLALSLQVELADKMHVYAPGVEGGYIPIAWKVDDSEAWLTLDAAYPESKTLHLEAINETVPVYEGEFAVVRDLVIGPSKKVQAALTQGALEVRGAFRYQACDDRMCYPPQTVPLTWSFQFEEHDWVDAPKELPRP